MNLAMLDYRIATTEGVPLEMESLVIENDGAAGALQDRAEPLP